MSFKHQNSWGHQVAIEVWQTQSWTFEYLRPPSSKSFLQCGFGQVGAVMMQQTPALAVAAGAKEW